MASTTLPRILFHLILVPRGERQSLAARVVGREQQVAGEACRRGPCIACVQRRRRRVARHARRRIGDQGVPRWRGPPVLLAYPRASDPLP